MPQPEISEFHATSRQMKHARELHVSWLPSPAPPPLTPHCPTDGTDPYSVRDTLPLSEGGAYTPDMSLARRTLTVLLLGFALVALPPPDVMARARKPSPPKEETRKPKLRLVVAPAVGYAPVEAVLTGELTGVDPHDANFCHAAITWIRIDPGQSEQEGLRVREDPACLHPREEVSVTTSFTRNYTLYRRGSYLFRLFVEGKDGTRIDSGFVKVTVLSIEDTGAQGAGS